MLLVALVACSPRDADTGAPAPADDDTPTLPALAVPDLTLGGEELVLDLSAEATGDWRDAEDPGALLEITVGANVRHVVIPGGVGRVLQSISLGAWDGGEPSWRVLAGEVSEGTRAAIYVDPSAADTPVLGTYDTAWWNDTPLVVYEEDGHWTWTFTDEDGGTGLLPTLLLARWGRPVDIEGLWDEASGTIQTTDHAWVPFDGPYEGTHPLFQVVTYNGLIGPLDDAPYLLSPMPLPFSPDGVQRERVLDAAPWVNAAAWAEAEREDLVVEDGGPEDWNIGAHDDYLFVDYDITGGARVAFEAEVDGAWVSSINNLSDSDGLTDARVSGLGRTCIELPPGADSDDITALRVRSYTDAGTVSARWFRYDDALRPVERGAAEAIAFDAAGTASLE